MDRCIYLVINISFLFTALFGPSTISSQVILSPPPSDVCYGDVVELLCQPTGGTAQYSLPNTLWRENTMPLRAVAGTPYALCVEESTIRSDPLNVNFTTRMEDGTTVTPTTPPDNGTDPSPSPETGLIAGVVMACIVVILVTIAIIIIVVSSVMLFTCKKIRNGDSQRRGSGEVDEDKKNFSSPLYMNVEMDDGSVPMTTSPCYGKVELTSDQSGAVYANL